MAETYTSKYANGAAVDAALDKAESAVQGPASATDNAIARFNGETGALLQDGANATLADNGALTIATGAVTDSQPVLNLSQTWNDAADTFTAIKANVTDTASASASMLLDLQVGGSSKLRVDKNGNVILVDGSVTAPSISFSSSGTTGLCYAGPNNGSAIVTSSSTWLWFRNENLQFPSTGGPQWSSNTTIGGASDIALRRDDANILAQRSDTNAQEFRLYGSYTSATAYQRLSTKTIREAVTCAAGASVTTTISIPKYTHLIGVTTRVTTAIGTTNSTTGYQVGDGTDPDLWGAITGTAQGTTSDRTNFTAVDALGPDGADRTITLTAVGGNFDGTGVIEVCAYYLAAEAD